MYSNGEVLGSSLHGERTLLTVRTDSLAIRSYSYGTGDSESVFLDCRIYVYMFFKSKLHALYRLTPKRYICYIIYVADDSVCKIGRTCRLQYRLNNLRTGIYRKHEVFVIHCQSAHESLMLERFLKRQLKPRHVVGEWHSSTCPEDIQALLVNDFGHLLLEPYEANTDEIPHVHNRKPEEKKTFDIFLS